MATYNGTNGNDSFQANLIQVNEAWTIYGNDGNDTLTGSNYNDIIYGGNGDDFIDGGYGFDLLVGGAGIDTVSYDFYSGGINANLTTGVVSFPGNSILNDTLRGIENVIGSRGNDVLTGSVANNVLSGGDGNDSIYGGAGNDVLDGNAGNNLLNGGAGNDIFFVNSIGDVVVEAANGGTDSVFSAVNYTLTANVENLTLYGSATIGTGNNLNNVIKANNNSNFLNGGDGKDTLMGGLGHDYLNGGAGNDVLNAYGGGYEVDDLTGGAGADKFIMGDTNSVFYTYPGLLAGNYDYAVIADFKVSENDKVQLQGNASNYLLGVGGGSGYGTAAADTFIYYNTNGSSGSGNLVAILADVSNLSLTGNSFTYI